MSEPALPDSSSPGALEAALRQPPDIVISTLLTWDAIGEWFAQMVARRSDSDAVRARARALTEGLAADRDRLAALAAFVGEKVRYLSLPLGSRRYEPRSAADVLITLYGDCKDKHTLLAALGAAVGIDIRPVLIHSSRDLLPDAPSVSQFDHVVSLARLTDGSDVWVDTTAAVYPAVLPPSLRGRSALLVGTRPPPTVVARRPAASTLRRPRGLPTTPRSCTWAPFPQAGSSKARWPRPIAAIRRSRCA